MIYIPFILSTGFAITILFYCMDCLLLLYACRSIMTTALFGSEFTLLKILLIMLSILVQEEVIIGKDGTEETVALLEPNSSFGEVSILCNIPQPYTIRVCELSRLLRIDKQSFSNIVDIYFHDGRRILTNLLEVIYIYPYI